MTLGQIAIMVGAFALGLWVVRKVGAVTVLLGIAVGLGVLSWWGH